MKFTDINTISMLIRVNRINIINCGNMEKFRRKGRISALCLCLILSVFLQGCAEVLPASGTGTAEAMWDNTGESTVSGNGENEKDKPDNEELEKEQEEVIRPKVKGIFVTGPMAGTSNMDDLIALVDDTELNAIVLDMKNDEGRVVYDMQIPAVCESGAGIKYVGDMESLVSECKEKDIYLIARIVAFKDPFLADVKPEWCIHNADGSVFHDKSGLAWLNPYNQDVWTYLLDIAEEALRIGFDEVQFDYIRFSTDEGMKDVDFGQAVKGRDRQQIITDFVKYASERVHEAGGAISADVYGMVIDSVTDQQIVGQNYVEMSKYLDYISPMIYPSHYGPYNYNIPVPDAEPYLLVLTAMQSSKKVLAGTVVNTVSGNAEQLEFTAEEVASLVPMKEIRARVRPWLQDFTATWVAGHIPYGEKEIRDQIQAVYDAGYEEWMLWNASNHYTEEGLLKEE